MNITWEEYDWGTGTTKKEVITLSPKVEAEIKQIQKLEEAADARARKNGFNADGLCAAWCREDEHNELTQFRCYPQYDECSCGIRKEHVHCGHGYVTQVG